ncbi:MAG: DNA polymerase III subunit gamma/tau [Dehalococcoidales bacterium]|nr:DNA polymerase III subunit gamma/tau [Dehalococcoidales bacterium]
MSSQVFYRKWRPQTLAEVVGQEAVTQTLLHALASERVSHAYLFCGPRGTGKTSTGRILAKAVNCLTNQGKGEPCNTCPICQSITEGRAMDVIEVDAASNRGIDEIRDLREKVTYAPTQARHKVYIIDEVHMLTKEASNALLKTLEEPPPHVIFILATTEAHKVLPTILSRCQRFDFRRISQTDVVNKLAQVCQTEGIKIEPQSLSLIARTTTGSLRDAENLLQQLTTYYGTEISLRQVQELLGITGDARTRELVKQLVSNEAANAIATINAVNRDGLDLRQFNRELVSYLRALLLVKTGSENSADLPIEDIKELKEIASRTSLPQVLRAVKLFGQLESSFDGYSTLPLELAIVECTIPANEDKTPAVKSTEPELAAKRASPQTTPKPPAPARGKSEAIANPAKATSQITHDEPSPPKTETIDRPQVKPAAARNEETPAAKAELPKKTSNPPPAPLKATTEIEQLQLNWRQLIKEMSGSLSRTPAAALLRSAMPRTMEDNVVVLSFKYTALKENMERLDNQKTAEKILSSFLGHSCLLRCVCEPEDNHMIRAAQKMGAQIIDVEEK